MSEWSEPSDNDSYQPVEVCEVKVETLANGNPKVTVHISESTRCVETVANEVLYVFTNSYSKLKKSMKEIEEG